MSEDSRPIALFIPALNGGGAQKVVVNLANALIDLTDRPIHVVLVRAEGVFLRDLRPEVQVHNLGKSRTLAAVFSLRRYLRRERPIVLMSRMNYANIAAAVAWLLAMRTGRLVLSEANVVRPPLGSTRQRLRMALSILAMRFLYPLGGCVVANSEGTANSLRVMGISQKKGAVVICNPVLKNLVSLDETKQHADSRDPKTKTICAIGRLAPQKGFSDLLLAFSRLKDPCLRLVILGEGPLRQELQELTESLGVGDRVNMPGFVDDPAAILKTAELFVLSSHWEGFGNVLVEALAAGIPIVSTDCPGAPRTILLDGTLGHLVPPENPEALAAAITEALHAPRGTPEARRQRANDFAAPVIAKQYLERAFGFGTG